MAIKTDQLIKQQNLTIKNETVTNANTANRVGGALDDQWDTLLNKLAGKEDKGTGSGLGGPTRIIQEGTITQSQDNPLQFNLAGWIWEIGVNRYSFPFLVILLDQPDPLYARIDLITLPAANDALVVKGTPGEVAAKPTYDSSQAIEIGLILVTPDGPEWQPSPNDHKQNTDTHLAIGTENQVSAEELRRKLDEEVYTDEKAVEAIAAKLVDSPTIVVHRNPATGNISFLVIGGVASGGDGGWDVKDFTGDGSTTVFSLPNTIIAASVSLGGVKQSKTAGHFSWSGKDITFPTAPADGERIVVEYVFGTVSGNPGAVVDFATIPEEIAGSITGKASTPGGRSSWWAKVLDGTIGSYFSAKISALKLELGNALAAGANRIIEAIGSATDIAIRLKVKGNAYAQLEGPNYVTSAEKVMAIDSNGNLVPLFELAEEFSAVPVTLTSTGIPGQKAWDSLNAILYYCIATNTWIRLRAEASDFTVEEMYVAVPSAAGSSGIKGQRAYDAANSLMYECVATNTWIRWTIVNTW